jgi:hypothetical protein
MTTPNSSEIDCPEGLRWGGRRLWESVQSEFELSTHEENLLLNAARTVDLLDLLEAHISCDGPIIQSPTGPRTHPAVIEARAQKIALARLLAAVGLPTGVGDDGQKQQRRSGPRGFYAL